MSVAVFIAELSYVDLNLGHITFKPQSIEVFDSLLLISDPIEGDLYLLVNLHTGKLECKGGQRGEGPQDMLYGAIIDKIDDDKFQVVDVMSRKNCVFSIAKILDECIFEPITIYPYNQEKENDERLVSLYQINDSSYLGLGMFEKGKYLLRYR